MKPVVLVPACVREADGIVHHQVGDKYLTALTDGSGVIPLILPSMGRGRMDPDEIAALADDADGLFLTGSPSNVEPHRYGGPDSAPGTRHDPWRDETMLPTIRAAVDRGVPIFAVCRGIQELNVALGGTLHQRVHELPGRFDHLGDISLPMDVRYGPRHSVRFTEGSLLARLAGREQAMVSSYHRQAIDAPAPGLVIEARAPDGTIEGVRIESAPYFGLAVQWHPEYRFSEDSLSRAMFRSFGDAARAYRKARSAKYAGIAAGSQ